MVKKKADLSPEVEDVTVYPPFETQTQTVSTPTGDALPPALHEAIAKLNAEGCHVVATNLIQRHLYEGDDHRAVLTYVKAPFTEKRPVVK